LVSGGALSFALVLMAGEARPARAEPPLPAAAQAEHGISFEALLRVAVARAPVLSLAREREMQARRSRDAVPSQLGNPTLGIQAGPRFERGGDATDYDLGVSLSQPVEVAGERGLRLEAAERHTRRLAAETALTGWELRHELLLAYRTAQVLEELLAVAQRAVAFGEQLVAVAERRRTLGEGSSIEVRIAQADAAEAGREQSVYRQELLTARIRLGELSGFPGEVAPRPSDPIGALPELPSVEPLLAQLSPQHPELSARERAADEALSRVAVATREAAPVPVFGASFVREGSVSGSPNFVVLGSLSLPLPLFRRSTEERVRAQSEELVARGEIVSGRLRVRARVRRAHAELAGALERVNLLSRAAASFEEGLELLQRGFKAGEIELANVSLARERWFSSLTGALQARLDCERAWTELEAALGRELERSSSAASGARR
jgi:cobalt-zinc-cadmium efflux system outer membrane protein